MRHLSGDVENPRHVLDCIEVLRERLPFPIDPLTERGSRNVFDTLHEFDEELLFAGSNGGEPDTAVAHHHRGDAVPAGRRDVRVPRDLGVVVGVDVDEPGGDEPAGVDTAEFGTTERDDWENGTERDDFDGIRETPSLSGTGASAGGAALSSTPVSAGGGASACAGVSGAAWGSPAGLSSSVSRSVPCMAVSVMRP